MSDGAITEGRSVRAPEDKRLSFKNFSGQVMVKHANGGKALLLVIHDDGHTAFFEPNGTGWRVT